MGAWYIWWQRREFVKVVVVAPPPQSAFAIQTIAMNYVGAYSKPEPQATTWCRPPRLSYKLNIDASFF